MEFFPGLDVTLTATGLPQGAFGFFLTRAKLVPAKDPRLVESISFQNF